MNTIELNEQQIEINGINLTYQFKPASSDREHLVVIFTGFHSRYDLLNVAKTFKCHVLWIKDDYEGTECYYLGKNGGTEYADAIHHFIQNTLSEKHLTTEQCTLLGGSKGGFAALYIGLMYNYLNIISVSFISKINDHMFKMRPDLAKIVMNDMTSKDEISRYSTLLDVAIYKDNNPDKNIYLIVSENDPYYLNHEKPMLPLLEKYNNFNVFKSNSSLIFKHNLVMRYNIPLIISLVNSLMEGITPKFGLIERNTVVLPEQEIVSTNQVIIAEIDKATIKGSFLNIEGVALFQNISYLSAQDDRQLVLTHQDSIYSIPVATVTNQSYSAKYYHDRFFDYRNAGFTISDFDLSVVPDGIYEIEVKISNGHQMVSHDILYNRALDQKILQDNIEYRLWSHNSHLIISKRSLLNITHEQIIFDVRYLDFLSKGILHIEGVFAVPGVELSDWGDAKYYLSLEYNNELHKSFTLGGLNRPKLNTSIDSGYGIYQKSFFSTVKKAGIDIRDMVDGVYDIAIFLSYKGSLFKRIAPMKLLVNHQQYQLIE